MSRDGIGRRALLATGAAWLAAPALRAAAAEVQPLGAILAASGLAGRTGFALIDLESGALVEGLEADRGRPPASVAKILTTLYALDALGPDYRFATRLIATGPVAGGLVQGDLVLAGGGDPTLDTDGLAALVRALAERGVTGATGRLLVADGALPRVAEIDGDQPDDASYNPSISGVGLNFNRVFAAWQAGGGGLSFTAPGSATAVPVASVRGELVSGGQVRLRVAGGTEIWSLPRDGMRRKGSVWLPVRRPAAYAGEVMRGLGGAASLTLPDPEVVRAVPDGGVLALKQSDPLVQVLREMLLYSTNLTAETVGLRASQARGLAPEGLRASAGAMTGWARARFGLEGARFVNHSGLSGATEIAPQELVAVLRQAEPILPGLLKPRPVLDAQKQPVAVGVAVMSKTGTMNFVSGLAGYLIGRRRMAFAILAADPGLRARVRPDERDDPPGNDAWVRRAKAQEQALLRRWGALHAA